MFLTKLELEFIDGRLWLLTAPLRYETKYREIVDVPSGFVTDFASVPRVLWNVLPPIGRYGEAAVVHDWLYQKRVVLTCLQQTRLIDRGEADRTLLQAMAETDVARLTRWTIYAGVRSGGWLPWKHYREGEQHG